MMTFGKLFGYGLVYALLVAFLHILSANVLNTSTHAVDVAVWVALVIVAIACSRRVGILNYLEAVSVAVVWFLLALLLDAIFTTHFVQPSVFSRWETWLGYLVGMLSIFFFHRKRHVEIRRQLAEKAKQH